MHFKTRLNGFLHKRRALLCVLLLTACATTPPPPVQIPARPARDSILSFGLTGRAIIRQAARADTMRLAWEHSPTEDAMGFSSSLGMVVAELQRDANGARWMTADGERFEARSADQLMARITDQPVPIDALSRWVVGRVGPGVAATRDAKGRLLEATDEGWTVRVLGYETELPEALPSSVQVEHGTLRIRLAIEEWSL